ncbi:MAG: AAA family ATPase [Candidatus Woesearchaeota archaeon]
MRVSCLGKGGSGKTTIAGALIRHISKNQRVLAIDADVNVNLHRALQIEKPHKTLGTMFSELATHITQNRTDILSKNVVATTPPSLKSTFLKPFDDSFITTVSVTHGNITLIDVGTYEKEDVGHTCYHGKLNTLELLYHHLLDKEDEVVIADATAGIDNLGTSLYFAYDVNFFVVEPTLQSIEVYKEFIEKRDDIKVYVIVNKVSSDEDITFIKEHIPDDTIIATFSLSNHLKKHDQGKEGEFEFFCEQNSAQLEKIFTKIKETKKDWKTYYQILLTTHVQNSIEWWDSYYGCKISEQNDPDFSYEKAFAQWR